MVFINMQPLDEVYMPKEAFCNGTLFPNLNKPFLGGRRR
ncbi:MAG: spore coat associated protein CotJA [Clostridia bacterium]|nr:spore coat associated protein CotJA [Clostridia bacterium]